MDPEDIRAWQNHGVALLAIRQPLRALQSFDEGLALCKRRLDEENKTALIINRLTALQELGRSDEARQEFERLAELAPHHEYVLGLAFEQRQAAADWRNYESTVRALVESVERGIVQRPFSFIGVSDSPGEHLRCAQRFARNSNALDSRAPISVWSNPARIFFRRLLRSCDGARHRRLVPSSRPESVRDLWILGGTGRRERAAEPLAARVRPFRRRP
jgi:tetratricopeptide (TPR) repeat protein